MKMVYPSSLFLFSFLDGTTVQYGPSPLLWTSPSPLSFLTSLFSFSILQLLIPGPRGHSEGQFPPIHVDETTCLSGAWGGVVVKALRY